jgi:GT2 family glycosyltransferase
MKVVCVFTCFNRKKITKRAIETLQNNDVKIDFVIVDDNSSDGTAQMIKEMNNPSITLLVGNGNLFYGGGMRKGLQYLLDNNLEYDYLLIINDDVKFDEGIVDKMIDFSKMNHDSVVVGPTKNYDESFSYGGIRYKSKWSHKELKPVGPEDGRVNCDTFDGNCTIFPYNIFKKCGNFDEKYIHNFTEYDYGLTVRRNGFNIYVLNEYVGYCSNNASKNTWKDNTLSRKERIKKLQSAKGFPSNIVYYYFKKNFNIFVAIRCVISPYIRILLKK